MKNHVGIVGAIAKKYYKVKEENRMDKGDIQGIIELMDDAENFRPVVKKGMDILKSYGPEARELFNMLIDGIVNSKIRMVYGFEAAGFNRGDAISLTLGIIKDIQQGVQQAAGRKK